MKIRDRNDHGASTPFPTAPEICVEITSPSNSEDEIREKIRADLAAGAREVWIVAEDGMIEYHDQNGTQTTSAFNISVSLPNLGN